MSSIILLDLNDKHRKNWVGAAGSDKIAPANLGDTEGDAASFLKI